MIPNKCNNKIAVLYSKASCSSLPPLSRTLQPDSSMSSPVNIPTLTRSGSKLVSPASSFPSRGGFFRTHSQPEEQHAFLRSHSSSRRSHERGDGVQEPLLQTSWSSQKDGRYADDAERALHGGAELVPVPQKLTVWQELRRQCWLAGPMVVVNLLQYSITVVSVAFVGHLGELELASASIASSLAGVLGYYVLVTSFTCLLSFRLFFVCGYGAFVWLPFCVWQREGNIMDGKSMVIVRKDWLLESAEIGLVVNYMTIFGFLLVFCNVATAHLRLKNIVQKSKNCGESCR